jgi:hypothetical protein
MATEQPIRHGRKRREGIPLWGWIIGVLVVSTVILFVLGGVIPVR